MWTHSCAHFPNEILKYFLPSVSTSAQGEVSSSRPNSNTKHGQRNLKRFNSAEAVQMHINDMSRVAGHGLSTVMNVHHDTHVSAAQDTNTLHDSLSEQGNLQESGTASHTAPRELRRFSSEEAVMQAFANAGRTFTIV